MDLKHSKKIMASYSSGSLIYQLIQGVLIFMLFYFYEVEIGLNSLLTGIGLAIYAVWDAVNDPLVGHITDRIFGFTKKWGRRFPWMIVTYIPMLICFVLIFTPPQGINAQESPWMIFGWLIFTTCLFDTFESLFTINFWGLFPDKFRSRKERVSTSAMIVYIGMIGVVLANLLPPMIIVYGEISSYITMAWITVIISLVCWILMIPGARDDKEVVEKYIANYEEKEKEPYIRVLITAFKQKAFVAFLLIYMLYQVLTATVQGSLLYVVNFVLGAPASAILNIMIFLLIGDAIGVILWLFYNKKTGDNRKTMIYSAIVMICLTVIFTFLGTLTSISINILIWGIGLGGFWVMLGPVTSDVIDEAVANTGKRREGLYMGIRFFMSNIAKVIQALVLGIVHTFTGFVEGSEIQPASAVFGIQLHFGIIPAIFMAVGLILFWKLYDITPQKSKEIKEQLSELKL